MKQSAKSARWRLDYEAYLITLNDRYQAKDSPWYIRPFKWLWEHLIGIALWIIYGSVDRYHQSVASFMADRTEEDLKELRAAKDKALDQTAYYQKENAYRTAGYAVMQHWNPLKRRQKNLEHIMKHLADPIHEWMKTQHQAASPQPRCPTPELPLKTLTEELRAIKEDDRDYLTLKGRIMQLIADHDNAPSTSNVDRIRIDRLKLMDDLAHMTEIKHYGKRLFDEGVLWSPDLIACIDKIYHETPTGDEVDHKEEYMKQYEDEKARQALRWDAIEQGKKEQEELKSTPPESPRTTMRKYIIEPLIDAVVAQKRQKLP